MHSLHQFTVNHVNAGSAIPSHKQLSGVQFLADFQYSVTVHGERVIIKRDLLNAIVVMDKLHFVYDIFWAAVTVSSAEHSHCTAEVTPKNTPTTAD